MRDGRSALASATADGTKGRHGTVSVLIPSYNHAPYIRQCLDSVLGQTRPADEIIVLDDGSSDDTAKVVRPYLDRITFIEQENRGLIRTLNRGVPLCTGDYIVMFASDDWLAPDAIATMAAILDDHPDVGTVHAGVTIVDERGRPQAHLTEKLPPYPVGKHRDTAGLILRNYINGQANLSRREAFAGAGPYLDHPFCQDWQMWLTIALGGWQLYGVDRRLAFYRRHPDNLSRDQNLERALLDTVAMMDELAVRFAGNLSEAERRAFGASKRELLRKAGWAQLLVRGDRSLARRTFLRLALGGFDPKALAGLAASLLPQPVFATVMRNKDRPLILRLQKLLYI